MHSVEVAEDPHTKKSYYKPIDVETTAKLVDFHNMIQTLAQLFVIFTLSYDVFLVTIF